MKITKTKEIVTEDIEVKAGTYYFDIQSRCYKIVIEETDEDGYTKYKMETLNNFANIYSIRIYEDECTSENTPYEFKQFYLGQSGRKIEKEEFDLEKKDIINRINKL